MPDLDQANEYNGNSVVLPILKLVFGDKKLSPATSAEDLSTAKKTVLLHLFNNVQLWATNMNQRMFEVTGLGNRRADWARVWAPKPAFPRSRSERFFGGRCKSNEPLNRSTFRRLRLCRIGSAEFLPHLRAFANLKTIDFADTSRFRRRVGTTC